MDNAILIIKNKDGTTSGYSLTKAFQNTSTWDLLLNLLVGSEMEIE